MEPENQSISSQRNARSSPFLMPVCKAVAVITDNARYHHARLHKDWRQQQQPHFRLDFLPPYSPDCNPIERVWKLTRRQCLHNRYFHTLEEVIRTVENKFAEWALGNPTLHKLCAIT